MGRYVILFLDFRNKISSIKYYLLFEKKNNLKNINYNDYRMFNFYVQHYIRIIVIISI